jgi:hypothetical protein
MAKAILFCFPADPSRIQKHADFGRIFFCVTYVSFNRRPSAGNCFSSPKFAPMIFKLHQLQGIKSGTITHAFRRWEKPNVKKGSTMKTAVGVIRVTDLELIKENAITKADASKAGYESVDLLLKDLNKISSGAIYKVKLKYHSEDPRLELREKTDLTEEEYKKLKTKLDRLDKTRGPWVLIVMKLIKRYPERRAGDLAEIMQMDKLDFKVNVRKLKNLGLTISHEIGYSLSPLGEMVMERLERR